MQGDQGGTEVYEGGYNYLYSHAAHNQSQVRIYSFSIFPHNVNQMETEVEIDVKGGVWLVFLEEGVS